MIKPIQIIIDSSVQYVCTSDKNSTGRECRCPQFSIYEWEKSIGFRCVSCGATYIIPQVDKKP